MVRYARQPDVEAAPMQEETVLYHPVRKKFCVLNETAAFLWTALDQPRSADELARRVLDAFDGVEPAVASRDVDTALAELAELGVIVRAES